MSFHSAVEMFKEHYAKGVDIPWYKRYPFFLAHLLIFGGWGFFMAYSESGPDVSGLYMNGGSAILVYTMFYSSVFGRDAVKWMFINAALGLVGIYTQIGWLLALFGKDIDDYPLRVHVIPFLYFVLYTFLLRQVVLDITRSREDDTKRKRVEYGYVIVLTVIYLISYFLTKR